MADRISPGRLQNIDFMLEHPGRFSKKDIHEVAVELRTEVRLLKRQEQRTLSSNTDSEGQPSCPSSTTAATSAPDAPGSTV